MQLNNKEIEIKAIPIKRYAELLEVLEKVPELIEEITNTDNDKVVAKLPNFITQNLNEFIKIVSIGTGITIEEAGELSLMEIVKAVQEVIAVNQFAEVWTELKKVIPLIMRPTVKKPVEG